MKTFTISDGRERLDTLCQAALDGEDIGFVCNGRVLALREVEVTSSDYALREYGLTETDMNQAAQTIHEEIEAERKCGRIKTYRPGQFATLDR